MPPVDCGQTMSRSNPGSPSHSHGAGVNSRPYGRRYIVYRRQRGGTARCCKVYGSSSSRVRTGNNFPHMAPNIEGNQELATFGDGAFQDSHGHADAVLAHEGGMLLDGGGHVSLGESRLDGRDVVVTYADAFPGL